MSLYICRNPQKAQREGSTVMSIWTLAVCQCMFINCNTCSMLVGDVDNRGGYACKEVEGI